MPGRQAKIITPAMLRRMLGAVAGRQTTKRDRVIIVSVARRSRFWLSRAWRSRAIEVDIAIWAIDLAIIGCSG